MIDALMNTERFLGLNETERSSLTFMVVRGPG